MKDMIYRDEAIEAVGEWMQKEFGFLDLNRAERLIDALSALPSAEAGPTVIRSRTLMPTKDFKEWAERIRDVNPNAVVIPCDAEVVSAEAVQGWIPCSERLPSESGTYLTTTAKGSVCTDHYYANSTDVSDRHWSYRSRREPTAWMPLPEPYEEVEI